jgi:hypothetical protein
VLARLLLLLLLLLLIYAGVVLVNVFYSYKFNRSKYKLMQLFLNTDSCADSVKFHAIRESFLLV